MNYNEFLKAESYIRHIQQIDRVLETSALSIVMIVPGVFSSENIDLPLDCEFKDDFKEFLNQERDKYTKELKELGVEYE